MSAPPEQLAQVIQATLSPDANVRRSAEEHLKGQQKQPGHALDVLRLIAEGSQNAPAVRQAAAVHFKNLIKKGWDVHHDDYQAGVIALTDTNRITIKSHLVQLMCTTPSEIQVQLSESIALIAAVDYHEQWQDLLPTLVRQFHSPDPVVVVGILKTANSIFKSFRYVRRSDELYAKILYTLHHIQVPLLTLFQQTGQAVENLGQDKAALLPRMEALRLQCRVFYSLNYQDLPEFFEDHMSEWMTEFAKWLQYTNSALTDLDEETEPSPIDKLQSAIIENLSLYADKDEEVFLEYLPNFTRLVWNNLTTSVTSFTKHDVLATTSIRFLASLVKKHMHKNLFQEEATLRQIILQIVIPNLTFRDVDEELLEDNPHEYILTEVEGSDSDSRRNRSLDLLRSMCRHFEGPTTVIASEHVGHMLAQYQTNPNQQWRAKDAAVHLMMGIAIRRESQFGVSEINDQVNVMDFFQAQILPELQDTNHSVRPVLKATSIKFVSIFRNQFTKDQLIQLVPLLIVHLNSPVVVVHTFAAYTIERLLMTKQVVPTAVPGQQVLTSADKQPKITSTDLLPFLEPLFKGLFAIIDNPDENENDYVMKCVMRALATAGESVLPVTEIVLTKLTAALGRAAKNPRNPQFNHFLFESIAVLVKNVCSKDPTATQSFEPLLFEPFNIILQMDIAEFTPYVFQILAQLLEYRPSRSGLGQAYTDLFPPLLTPALWEKRGNVPALARLMQAYINQAAIELTSFLNPILGVFQKLISSKPTEASAFEILQSAVIHFPAVEMGQRMGTIFQILLTRLQHGKTPRLARLMTDFFALYVAKYGVQDFLGRLDQMQAGLGVTLLSQVWIPRLQTDPPVQRMEAKVQVIGLTKLVCEAHQNILSATNGQDTWSCTFAGLIKVLTSPTFKATTADGASLLDDDEVEIGYDATFSQLKYAKKLVEDPCPEIADPIAFFLEAFGKLPVGQLKPLMDLAVSTDPKLAANFSSLLQQAGIALNFA